MGLIEIYFVIVFLTFLIILPLLNWLFDINALWVRALDEEEMWCWPTFLLSLLWPISIPIALFSTALAILFKIVRLTFYLPIYYSRYKSVSNKDLAFKVKFIEDTWKTHGQSLQAGLEILPNSSETLRMLKKQLVTNNREANLYWYIGRYDDRFKDYLALKEEEAEEARIRNKSTYDDLDKERQFEEMIKDKDV